MSFNLRIDDQSFRTMQRRYRAATNNVNIVVDQRLREIAEYLRRKVGDELDTGDTYGTWNWWGTVKNSLAIQNVRQNEVDIVQDQEGRFVMYGTSPQPGALTPPKGLVDWAMDYNKLFLPYHEAYGAALGIFRKGILSGSRFHWPMGSRGYNWANMVVEFRERPYLEMKAADLGLLVVRYLDTGP